MIDNFAKWLYVSAEYHVEAYEIGLEPTGGRDQIELSDWRLMLGLRMDRGGLSMFIEGGIVFGLSAALFNQITIRDGRVEQTNFHDHAMPKLADSPSVTVEFIQSGAPLGGLGEPGVPPIAPAIANAVFAVTGKRLRTLPLRLA